MNLPTEGLRSKSWDEFARADAPHLDFIFTVCDNAAGEVCPVWPGHPITAHWGVADPAAVEGSDAQKWQAFREAFHELESRIKAFVSLPLESLDRVALRPHLEATGRPRTESLASTSASCCPRKAWARSFSRQPSSALASWPSDWRAATLRLPCWPTPARPSRSWRY